MSRYILALDQGTTSSRAILFDRSGNIIQMAQQEFTQHYPQPGWVEHNPNELFDSQSTVAARCLRQAGITGSEVAAVGITNHHRLEPQNRRARMQRHRLAGSAYRRLLRQPARTGEGRAVRGKDGARARRLFFRHESPLDS